MRRGVVFAAALVSGFPVLASAAPSSEPACERTPACEYQSDTCSTENAGPPDSGFRMGLAVMQEANLGSIYGLYGGNRRRHGVSANFDTDFGAEFSYALKKYRRTRLAFLFVPLSIDGRTRWPTGKDRARVLIHGTAFLELQIRGICLTAGTAEYEIGRSFRNDLGNWDNTALGIGIVLLRWPGWQGKNFFPEWRRAW